MRELPGRRSHPRMSSEFLNGLSTDITILGFLIGLPAILGAYYQSYKARHEAQQEREGTLHTKNCLEFVAGDGSCINLVPLETLHSLPRAGDIILLPGDGVVPGGEFVTGAYLVESVEQIYMPWDTKGARPREARLTKAVAHVTSINPALLTEAARPLSAFEESCS
jgi:hypothetical protein